jgi:hypothetical protein
MHPRCLLFQEWHTAHPINEDTCLVCKGSRLLCGKTHCPLLLQLEAIQPLSQRLERTSFVGPSPPALFVGWHQYPTVSLGPLIVATDTEDPASFDDPSRMFGKPLSELVQLRMSMVRSITHSHVKAARREKLAEITAESVLSTKPLDMEVTLKQKPTLKLIYSSVAQPMGPSAPLDRLEIVSNPVIPRRVDSITQEDSLSATVACCELFDAGFDFNYLMRLFSAGLLGRKRMRRFVPTRWSITAVDDLIGRYLMRRVRTYPELQDIQLYHGDYIGNHVEILFIPGRWSFEQFEAWAPGAIWTQTAKQPVIVAEHEGRKGRTSYALKEGGGYYAGRVASLEKLIALRRQATAILFREISEEYYCPIGVWEVRENVRNALRQAPERFSDLPIALNQAATRLRIPLKAWITNSTVLQSLLAQQRLDKFIES